MIGAPAVEIGVMAEQLLQFVEALFGFGSNNPAAVLAEVMLDRYESCVAVEALSIHTAIVAGMSAPGRIYRG